ncbi:MAG: phosphoribosyltransferase family protein [Cyclobacteriaceae bacterium]|nr:phosphoribosyltransferase family protein [Cyclobacteriaceae bacterium]
MHFLSDILDLIFPHVCCTCGERITKEDELICFGCRAELPKVKFSDPTDNELTDRFLGKYSLKFGTSYLYFFKSGKTQTLMHKFKYQNKPELGVMIGRYLGHDIAANGYSNGLDMIIPVPIHRKKLRIRGYNQSQKFASGLSEAIEIPVEVDVLIRTIHGESQTHKSKEERQRSVSEVFQLREPNRVAGKSILLVDDVITTGATLEACGKLLLNAGCAELSIATMAIAK